MLAALAADPKRTRADHWGPALQPVGHPGDEGTIKLDETASASCHFHSRRKCINGVRKKRCLGVICLERPDHLGDKMLIDQLAVENPLTKAPRRLDWYAEELQSVPRPYTIALLKVGCEITQVFAI